MRLLVKHFVGPHGAHYALQTQRVWPVQKKLLPEALGQLHVFIIVLNVLLAGRGMPFAGETHSEQLLIEANDLGLEYLRSRILGERRRLHRDEIPRQTVHCNLRGRAKRRRSCRGS